MAPGCNGFLLPGCRRFDSGKQLLDYHKLPWTMPNIVNSPKGSMRTTIFFLFYGFEGLEGLAEGTCVSVD